MDNGLALALASVLVILGAAGLFAYLAGLRPFVAPGTDAARHPFQGAGGDPALLAALSEAGIDLASLGGQPLSALRSTLDRCAPDLAPSVLLFRGRVIHNVTRRGVPGFVVTPLASPARARTVVRSAAGAELAPAITDRRGRYTLIGLPRGTELTNVLERPGFLELAYTARTVYPGDYQQDYVGTVPAYLVPSSHATGNRSAHDGERGTQERLGELALTVVFERSRPEAPDFGLVTEGKYEGNGVPGVRFEIRRLAGGGGRAGAGEIVYADNAAALLARRFGSWTRLPVRWLGRCGLRRWLELLELPAPDRNDTSALGLALVRALPEGCYEVAASHPTRTCLPTRDAWPAADACSSRVEVVAGRMGDARFYCLPDASSPPS